MKSHHHSLLGTLIIALALTFTMCKSQAGGKIKNDTANKTKAERNGLEIEEEEELETALESRVDYTRIPAMGNWTFEEFKTDISKPTELFRIDPTQDQYLEGEAGTRIFIPANSLTTFRQEPLIDSVTMSLREYYSETDFLRDGLSTVADRNLLQTGGTIELRAFDDDENLLRIAPNQTLGIFMPQDTIFSDMRWFIGDRRADGNINWRDQEKNLEFYTRTTTTITLEPKRIIKDYDGVELTYNFKDSSGTLSDYLATHPPFDDNELMKLPRNLNDLVVKFRIDEGGSMRNVVVERSTGSTKIDATLKDYITALPAFERNTASDPSNPNRLLSMGFHLNVDIQIDTIVPEKFPEANILRSNQEEGIAYFNFTESAPMDWSSPAPIYQIFDITQLGMINCDRYPTNFIPTQLMVRQDGLEGVQMLAYMPGVQGWIMGTTELVNRKIQKEFSLIPLSEDVLLVALRVRNGIPEFAFRKLERIKRNMVIDNLRFAPFTTEDLEEAFLANT